MEFIALLFFHSALHTSTHARTDTHKGLLISWPFLYSWYAVGEEMIGQIRHLISCHTHVVCMCIQNAAIAVTLFYSYAPTCTARLQWVLRAPGSGNDSDCSKRTRIQHSQNHFSFICMWVNYCLPNIVRVINSRMRWAGNVESMGEERGVYRVLVGKPKGKRPLWRPRRRWVDNIRMDLQAVGCGYVDWIGLAQDRDRWRTLVSAVMKFRVP